MRIKIKAKRPAFGTLFKVCAVALFAYVLAVFCLAGLAALFGAFHVDDRLGYSDLIVGFVLLPTAIPIGFGFLLAIPAWGLWSLYARFRTTVVVLHVESLADVEIVPEPGRPPGATPGTVTSRAD